MAIDIRATVTCSLGTLISGSLSDDYLQGSGLVKTRGSVEISALITPAIGTAVTFSYTKGGVVYSIPRKLRVMSSFADPFRRTTTVELGCKLTYLSDLQEPVDWSAFDDPANSSYTEADQRIVTLPISAASAMNKCLTELGITASSNPLTNKFSIAAFDFSAGYVQVLSDLLVSESYFGYLDANEVLQVRDLTADGGTGPVYTQADIVDLGPINTGQLPGEAVTVNYSTLKLKPPEDNTDPSYATNQAVRLWERNVTTAGPNRYYVGNLTFTGNEESITTTTYRNIAGSDLPVSVTTVETASNAKVAGKIGSDYVENGLGFNPTVETLREERTTTTYDDQGNQLQSTTTVYEQVLGIFGSVSLPYAFSSSDYVTFSNGLLPREKTVIDYLTIGEKQQEVVTTYKLWPFTLPGQQAVAAYGPQLSNSTQVSNYVNSIASAGLVYERTVVRINSVSETQGRPQDLLNGAYAKGGDPNNGWRTESTADLELALGSATAQRRIELSMPYAPDDTFSGPSGGPFTSVASDASAKANRYGRVQNRLLLGNRNGMNIQLAPERLPAAPFAPMYVQANGLTALYRANGNQWAFDANGIVCSTDALFWAAIGGTGTFWFPVAPGITTLPATPPTVSGEITPTAELLPYNETASYEAVIKPQITITKFDYALELLTEPAPIVITLAASVRSIPALVAVPTTNLSLEAFAPAISFVDPVQSSVVNSFIYTGTGTEQTIQTPYVDPSFMFIRDFDEGNVLVFDRVRGATKYWEAQSLANGESTAAQSVTAFGNASFTVGTSSLTNNNGTDYLVWAFEGVGAATTNTAGTITSTVSTTDVFSIATYTGNGTAGATFGHGLSGTPDGIIIACLDSGFGVPQFGGPVLGTNINVDFVRDDPQATTNSAQIRTASSTTVTVGGGGSSNVNFNTKKYVAYSFRTVEGRSKVAKYTGDGESGGQYIECGFIVDFVILKVLDASGGSWFVFNRSFEGTGKTWTSIGPTNPFELDNVVYSLEDTGFRVFNTDGSSSSAFDNHNLSGKSYVYMAFAAVRPTVYADTTTDVSLAAPVPTISAN